MLCREGSVRCVEVELVLGSGEMAFFVCLCSWFGDFRIVVVFVFRFC